MKYIIKTDNLTKEFTQVKGLFELFLHPFRKKKTNLALRDVNIEVKRAELVGLLGMNGAGKTTLLKILACLILPTKGRAYVNGFDITKDNQKIKGCVSLVTGEERSFYWRLTGRQNLEFFASLYNLSGRQMKSRIDDLFSLLEIRQPDKRFYEYSSGIKQRLALARGLLNSPQILLLDEPMKNLDYTASERLKKFIKKRFVQQDGKTVIIATSRLDDLDLYDRLVILDQGLVKAQGNIFDLQNNIGNPQATAKEIFEHYVFTEDMGIY